MKFTITQLDRCAVLTISGRIDSYTSPIIKDAINSIIADDQWKIVVDLSQASYISSSGILLLVNIKRKVQKNNGAIHLAATPKLLYSGFELSGFHQLFEFFDDVESAINEL
jgi:anti-sigma B factor antagonist